MADKRRDDINITTGKLTTEQAKRLRQIADGSQSVRDLEQDFRSGVVEPGVFAKAVLNPNNITFKNAKDYRDIVVRVLMDDGVTRNYDLTEVMSMMQRFIKLNALKMLGSLRMAYLRRYDPNLKLPDDADQDIITELDKVDMYVEQDFERDLKRDKVNTDGEKAVEEYRKLTYEKLITQAFIEAVYMLHAYKKSFSKIPNKEVVKELITKYSDDLISICVQGIRDCNNATDGMSYACLAMLFRHGSNNISPKIENLEIKDLTDNEVIELVEAHLGREEMERFIRDCGDCILDRKKVVKFITSGTPAHDHSKAGMFTQEEFKQLLDKACVMETYEESKNNELLQYMSQNQIIRLYMFEQINDRDLRKYLTLGDILDSNILYPNIKLKILLSDATAKKFSGIESKKIWSMYENGELTIEDVKKLEAVGYINIDDIIRQYIDNKKRAIAAELGEVLGISEEKLFEYFTPDRVLEVSRNKKDEELSKFYKSIRDLYERNGANLENEIAKVLKERSGLDEKALATEGFSLYKNGITSIEILGALEVPTEHIVNYCIEHRNDHKLLIDVFNAGLVPELTMFEDVLDTDSDLACELIQEGMSAKIIKGLESTKSLIEMTRSTVDEEGSEVPAQLTYRNLAEIKDDIAIGLEDGKRKPKTATLLSMYLNDQLTYAELYGLAQEGVISIDIANEINEKYSLIKDWEALKEKGVEGSPIEGLYDNPNPGPTPIIPYIKGAVGIDEDCIIDYYIALGATEYLEIDHKKCPVFKDYIVIPIIDKKVAYLEGKNGRTYIVPLKIVLEQINNPNGEMDLIGNAPSRNALNNQKEHIRSANHTRSWGRNVVMKTAELPSVPMSREEAKKFIIDNLDTIRAIETSYDKRKYEKTNETED